MCYQTKGPFHVDIPSGNNTLIAIASKQCNYNIQNYIIYDRCRIYCVIDRTSIMSICLEFRPISLDCACDQLEDK